MIDGLAAQNRALDGDTVIIQLLDPARWPGLTTSNLVITGNIKDPKSGGKPEFKVQGFTNETAIETRIIDMERGTLATVEIHQSSSIVIETIIPKMNEPKHCEDKSASSSDDEEEDDSGSEEEVDEEARDKALHDNEERDVDIDGAFDDDEVVASDYEQEEVVEVAKTTITKDKRDYFTSKQAQKQEQRTQWKPKKGTAPPTKPMVSYLGTNKQEVLV